MSDVIIMSDGIIYVRCDNYKNPKSNDSNVSALEITGY